MTTADAHNNLIRTSLESLAAVIAGSDSVQTMPIDVVFQPPDTFSRRIARNQQLILRHECQLDALIDPAGGSYYVEHLTDQLARSAWTLFQEIEARGGMSEALEYSMVQHQIAETTRQRADNLNRRKDVQVGINMYTNTQEHLPQVHDRARAEHSRQNSLVNDLSQLSGTALIEAVIEAVQQGATLGQIDQALRNDAGTGPQIEPLPAHRLSHDFEQLRHAAQGYAAQHGRPPQIFLAQLGNYQARADFTRGFFEPGGFDLMDQGASETPEQAAQAALDSGAPAVVICSSDSTYPEIVPPLVQAIKTSRPETYVILAGYPQDQIVAHRAAMIDDFIHLKSNCFEMNLKLLRQIGVRV